MMTRSGTSAARSRAAFPFGLLLALGTVAVAPACTTEVITPVPSEEVEEPGAEQQPEPDGPDADDASSPNDGSDDRGQPDDGDSDSDDGAGDDGASDDDGADDGGDGGDADDDSDSGAPDIGDEVTGIPTGQMPPPGACRIWDPDLSPGRQGPSGDCDDLRNRLPAGSWLLYRPGEAARVYRIG